MNDTPETDAAYKNHAWDMHDHIPIEFSRKLERERDAAIADLNILCDKVLELNTLLQKHENQNK
jgi:hypothetical protein